MVRGPFDALVHLEKRELTLVLQGRYAGRFRIGIGRDEPKLEGEYTVCLKSPEPPPYSGPEGLIAPGDPENPLGAAWIGLTEHIGIHGTNNPQGIGRDNNRGYICLGARDLQDLYGILTVGSSHVTVMRSSRPEGEGAQLQGRRFLPPAPALGRGSSRRGLAEVAGAAAASGKKLAVAFGRRRMWNHNAAATISISALTTCEMVRPVPNTAASSVRRLSTRNRVSG